MPARFRIKRHKMDVLTARPWVLKDRQRPAFVGQYATHDLALAAMDRRVADEHGMPTLREIRERIEKPVIEHVNIPCPVEPIIDLEGGYGYGFAR